MKIKPNFSSFDISAKGMSIYKKKMDLIAENIANTSTTKTEEGTPYKRKYLSVNQKKSFQNHLSVEGKTIRLNITSPNHISEPAVVTESLTSGKSDLSMEVVDDEKVGDSIYMPDHPDADDDGYVLMPNVNVITEMVDMIAASRSYEANLTAFDASKQMAKDSLEI